MTTTATRRQTADEKTPSAGTFTAGYRALVDALKTLALPAAGRKPLPVFSRVLATVRPGEVELTTFDFDTAATVTLPVTGAAPGRMLLDHPSITKVLAAAVKGSPKASNGGLLAVRMLAMGDDELRGRLVQFAAELRDKAEEKGKAVRGGARHRLGF